MLYIYRYVLYIFTWTVIDSVIALKRCSDFPRFSLVHHNVLIFTDLCQVKICFMWTWCTCIEYKRSCTAYRNLLYMKKIKYLITNHHHLETDENSQQMKTWELGSPILFRETACNQLQQHVHPPHLPWHTEIIMNPLGSPDSYVQSYCHIYLDKWSIPHNVFNFIGVPSLYRPAWIRMSPIRN